MAARLVQVQHPLCLKESIRPFKSLVTVKNGYGQLVTFHFNFGCGNFDELEAYLKSLLQRSRDLLADPSWSPKMVVVDNCCQTRGQYKRILGDGVIVKLDVWHWLDRWSSSHWVTRTKKGNIRVRA